MTIHMQKFYCYRIRHKESGKSYIGIASGDVNRRWRQHKHEAARGNSHLPLYRAMKTHGIDAFEFRVLFVGESWDQICEKERELIALYKTLVSDGHGYNLAEGGQGPFGVERSPETRRMISQRTSEWFEKNPDAREHLRAVGKEQMNSPSRVELSREAARKQWLDPVLSAKSKAALERFWARPDANTIRSGNQKRLMADPERRHHLRAKAREQMNDPKNRESSRNGALQQWADPEFRQTRVGSRHPMARHIIAQGKEFGTIKEAAAALSVSTAYIRKRGPACPGRDVGPLRRPPAGFGSFRGEPPRGTLHNYQPRSGSHDSREEEPTHWAADGPHAGSRSAVLPRRTKPWPKSRLHARHRGRAVCSCRTAYGGKVACAKPGATHYRDLLT